MLKQKFVDRKKCLRTKAGQAHGEQTNQTWLCSLFDLLTYFRRKVLFQLWWISAF